MTNEFDSADLKIVRGEPTAEELAAIILVLRDQVRELASKNKSRSEWNSPHRSTRNFFAHGNGMWRRSALPH